MKKLIITLAALIMMGATSASAATQAQNQAKSQPKTEQVTGPQGKKVKNNGTLTKHTYKGYPVYQGSKGGLYVERVSKRTGKPYRQYLNKRQQAKLK